MKIALLVTAVAILAFPSAVEAQGTADLDALVVAAQNVCQKPELYGYVKNNSGQISGSLNTDALMRKFAQLGLSATAKSNSSEWKGTLQTDTLRNILDYRLCTQNMMQLFLNKFDVRPKPAVERLSVLIGPVGPYIGNTDVQEDFLASSSSISLRLGPTFKVFEHRLSEAVGQQSLSVLKGTQQVTFTADLRFANIPNFLGRCVSTVNFDRPGTYSPRVNFRQVGDTIYFASCSLRRVSE